MSTITISDLRPAGADLFSDADSYFDELTDAELTKTCGGTTPLCLAAAGGLLLLAGCSDSKPTQPAPPPLKPQNPIGANERSKQLEKQSQPPR